MYMVAFRCWRRAGRWKRKVFQFSSSVTSRGHSCSCRSRTPSSVSPGFFVLAEGGRRDSGRAPGAVMMNPVVMVTPPEDTLFHFAVRDDAREAAVCGTLKLSFRSLVFWIDLFSDQFHQYFDTAVYWDHWDSANAIHGTTLRFELVFWWNLIGLVMGFWGILGLRRIVQQDLFILTSWVLGYFEICWFLIIKNIWVTNMICFK